jgi:hypothetical protein
MSTINSFEDHLTELHKALPDINMPRIKAARDDLANFSLIHSDLANMAQSIARPNFMEEFEDLSGRAKDRSVIHLGNRMDSFLRAGIVFGDVTNKVLLQEVRSKGGRDFPITQLSHKTTSQALRGWASKLDEPGLVAAHCLCVYRNKLLLHFDTPRVLASEFSHTNMANRRLVPISFAAPPDMYQKLEAIANRHEKLLEDSGLQNLDNLWRLLEVLFYGVPPLVGTEPNCDREYIDYVSAHGGIRSPSMSEVVTGVDSFLVAVTELCLAGNLPQD